MPQNKIQEGDFFKLKDSTSGGMDEDKQFFKGRGNRLNGGNSDNGGLANVNYNSVGNHWNNRAFRFLEVSK